MSQEHKSEIRRAIELIDGLKLSLLDIDQRLNNELQKDDESRNKIRQLLLGELTRDEKKILEFLKTKTEPLPRKDLTIRYHNTLGSPRIEQALRTLVQRGLIHEDVTSTRGRPLTTYSFIA